MFRYNEPVSCLLTSPPQYVPNANCNRDDTYETDPSLQETNWVCQALDRKPASEQALNTEPVLEQAPKTVAFKQTSKKMVQKVPKGFNPMHPSDLDRFAVKALKNHCNALNLDKTGNRHEITQQLLIHYNLRK